MKIIPSQQPPDLPLGKGIKCIDNLSRLGYRENTVASIKCGGIQFVVHSNDHPPRHVHGLLAETEVIVDLRMDGSAALADRKDAIRPGGAKRSDVRTVLEAAAEHFDELVALWEKIHGKAQSHHDRRRTRSRTGTRKDSRRKPSRKG